jgi:hypothetical protein
MRSWVANGVAQAWSNGEMRGWHTNGQHRAHLYWWHEPRGFHGAPTQNIVLDWAPGDREAEQVAISGLREALTEFGADAEIQLLPFQQRAVKLLLSEKFTVLGHILMGETQVALEQLLSRLQPPKMLKHLGLTLARARSCDVEAMLELQRSVFAHDAWACWFGTEPHYIDTVVRPMLDGTRESANFCIWRDSEIVGSFGADIERQHPFWGDIAGVDFVLHPSIQKQGVVKTAYRCVLEELAASGVGYFKGGTLQPAVFELAKLMGRYSVGLHLHRRQVPRPPTEFDISSFLLSS